MKPGPKPSTKCSKCDADRDSRYSLCIICRHQFGVERNIESKMRSLGLTREHYDAVLAAQNYRCAICKGDMPTGRGTWHVDHCHTTNQFRGLLCNICNSGLGFFKDSIEILKSAIEYISRAQQRSVVIFETDKEER